MILQFPSVKIDGTEQLKGNRGKVSIPDHDTYQKVISDIETTEKILNSFLPKSGGARDGSKAVYKSFMSGSKEYTVFFTDFLKRKFKTDDLNTLLTKREKREYREQLTSINDFFELQEKATTSKPDTDFIERHYISPIYISPTEYKKYLCIYATSQLFSYKKLPEILGELGVLGIPGISKIQSKIMLSALISTPVAEKGFLDAINIDGFLPSIHTVLFDRDTDTVLESNFPGVGLNQILKNSTLNARVIYGSEDQFLKGLSSLQKLVINIIHIRVQKFQN